MLQTYINNLTRQKCVSPGLVPPLAAKTILLSSMMYAGAGGK